MCSDLSIHVYSFVLRIFIRFPNNSIFFFNFPALTMSAIEYFISLCEECNERAYICITLLSVVDQREHEQRVAVRAEFLQFCDYMNGECFCVECICAFYGCFVLHRICHETKSERERERIIVLLVLFVDFVNRVDFRLNILSIQLHSNTLYTE